MRVPSLLLLMCVTSGIYSQSIDTVFVGLNQTVTLAFPGPVSLVDIGKVQVFANGAHQALFYHQIQGELVMLKALQIDTATTSLFVRFNQGGTQGYYSAVLAVKAQVAPEQMFLQPIKKGLESADSTKITPPREEAASPLPDTTNSVSKYEEELQVLKEAKQTFRSIGAISGDIMAGLYSMGVDEEALYMRLELWNKSKFVYELAQVQILQSSDQATGKFSAGPVLVDVKHMEIPTEVAVGENGSLLLVLPVAVVKQADKKSFLSVRIREQQGNRHISFKISGKILLKTPNL